jgi:hypothetical protein
VTTTTERLLDTIQSLITQHHTIYRRLPPQGIYFESLMERAFDLCGAPGEIIDRGQVTAPSYDVLVGRERLSLKTETGRGTNPSLVKITKLCTTEKEPWTAGVLISRVLEHLSRYDRMLMLRAIWGQEQAFFRYQFVEVPLSLLRLISTVVLAPVGKARERRSLAGNVSDNEGVAFRVTFDGADGKCVISGLPLTRCSVLRQWEQRV